MAKPKNSAPTLKIAIATHPTVGKLLDQLIPEGLFGKNRAEVAEGLLREKLRDLRRAGELGRKSK